MLRSFIPRVLDRTTDRGTLAAGLSRGRGASAEAVHPVESPRTNAGIVGVTAFGRATSAGNTAPLSASGFRLMPETDRRVRWSGVSSYPCPQPRWWGGCDPATARKAMPGAVLGHHFATSSPPQKAPRPA